MPNIAKCRNCGKEIDQYSYFNALFCSNRCRTQFCRRKKELYPKQENNTLKDVTGGDYGT